MKGQEAVGINQGIGKLYFNLRKVFDCEGDHIVEQVAQRGFRLSIAGGVQNPAGNSPQSPALMGLESIYSMGLDNLQRLLQASTILWSSLTGFYSIKYTIKKETEVIKPSQSNRGSSIRWNKNYFDNTWDYFQERKKKKKSTRKGENETDLVGGI